MKQTILTNFLLLMLSAPILGQNEFTFFVLDSIINLSSYQEISREGRVFGMPLWEELPDSVIKQRRDEFLENRSSDQNEFGVNRAAWYVQNPSLLFFPAGQDTLHPAGVILPGGAFQRIVIDKEGVDVAQRLNQSGVSAVVVKYRTLPTSYALHGIPNSLYRAMYADARQAIKIVREKASGGGVYADVGWQG